MIFKNSAIVTSRKAFCGFLGDRKKNHMLKKNAGTIASIPPCRTDTAITRPQQNAAIALMAIAIKHCHAKKISNARFSLTKTAFFVEMARTGNALSSCAESKVGASIKSFTLIRNEFNNMSAILIVSKKYTLSTADVNLKKDTLIMRRRIHYHALPNDDNSDDEMPHTYQAISQDTTSAQLARLADYQKPMTVNELRKLIHNLMDEFTLSYIHLYQTELLSNTPDLLTLLLKKQIACVKKTIFEECNTLLLKTYPEVDPNKFSLSLFKKTENRVVNRLKLLGIRDAISNLTTLKLLLVFNDNLHHCKDHKSLFRNFLQKNVKRLAMLTIPQLKMCLLEEIRGTSSALAEVILHTKQIESLQVLFKENETISEALHIVLNTKATETAALKATAVARR